MPNQARPCDLSKLLEAAASAGKDDIVADLLAQGADPVFDEGRSLAMAAWNGRASCVELLLSKMDRDSASCRALFFASFAGHLECAKLLLPRSPSLAEDSAPLMAAIVHGHAAIVAFMLEAADPSTLRALNLRALEAQARSLNHHCVAEALLGFIGAPAHGSKESRSLASAASARSHSKP